MGCKDRKKALCIALGVIIVLVACCLWLAEYGRSED